MSEYAITVKDLVKEYKNKTAIDHMSFQLNEGEIIGLIGANGSGKTTFFKMCVGLEDITAGSICVFGEDPQKNMAIRSEMIYSMHDLPVGDRKKLRDIVTYYAIMFPHFDREFAEKLIRLFELPYKKSYKTLSQGMKSLFHFCCALATRCRVNLLDEPFIGIDIKNRKMAYDILLRDYMEHPRTFVISSHNLAELEKVLSEMVLIHKGELMFYESMDNVREMLCRISGSKEEIEDFAEGLSADVVVNVAHGEMGSDVVVRGSVAGETAQSAKEAGLDVSAVSPEDVTVYLTGNKKEDQMSELWE